VTIEVISSFPYLIDGAPPIGALIKADSATLVLEALKEVISPR
jgi:hypothetical protein